MILRRNCNIQFGIGLRDAVSSGGILSLSFERAGDSELGIELDDASDIFGTTFLSLIPTIYLSMSMHRRRIGWIEGKNSIDRDGQNGQIQTFQPV